jgi:hypothetical protein
MLGFDSGAHILVKNGLLAVSPGHEIEIAGKLLNGKPRQLPGADHRGIVLSELGIEPSSAAELYQNAINAQWNPNVAASY